MFLRTLKKASYCPGTSYKAAGIEGSVLVKFSWTLESEHIVKRLQFLMVP
jgi:hypothetical protein